MTERDFILLRARIAAEPLEYAIHATRRMLQRIITEAELRAAGTAGQLVEDYPRDFYGPSCLIFGRTPAGRPLHVVCSYPGRPKIKIITVYEPDTSEWLSDFKTRQI